MIKTINHDEMLRYLGHRGQEIPAELGNAIDNAKSLCLKLAKPRSIYRIFDIDKSGGLSLCGAALELAGSNIQQHLKNCGKTAVFAATLGTEIDINISLLSRTDLSAALLLDAAATTLIEQVCDEAENEICKKAAEDNFFITTRFSPGYGDFPIDAQPNLLNVLDAGKKIGLSCTSSMIMTPQKSVTAIIGLGKGEQTQKSKCAECSLKNSCTYRALQ